MNAEYKAARLEDCREIEALIQERNRPAFAEAIRGAKHDGALEIWRHFSAYDAGYARARAEMENLKRPIVGIENRTAQEVFEIMADRISHAINQLTQGDQR